MSSSNNTSSSLNTSNNNQHYEKNVRIRFFAGYCPAHVGLVGIQNVRDVSETASKLSKGFHSKVNVQVTIQTQEKKVKSIELVPTVSALIIKKIHEKNRQHDLTMNEIKEIARIVRPRSKAKTFKGCVKEVLGSCVSCSCLVEGKSPKAVMDEIFYGTGGYVFEDDNEEEDQNGSISSTNNSSDKSLRCKTNFEDAEACYDQGF